jgi:hypothetical protein
VFGEIVEVVQIDQLRIRIFFLMTSSILCQLSLPPNNSIYVPHGGTNITISPEAFILVKPVKSETVLEAVSNRIELLEKANKSNFGYTELMKISTNLI